MSRRWLLLVLAGLVPATVARAAYEPELLPDSSKHWAINVGLRGEYDDNIFTVHTNTTSSFKSIVEPQVLVNLPSDRNFVGLRYSYRMIYYENRPGTQIDQEHQGVFLFSHTFTPRLTLDVNDRVVRGLEPELNQPTLGNPVVLRQRGDYLDNNLNGTLSYNLSRRWVVSLNGGWELWNYDVTEVATNNNRNIYQGTLSLLYALDQRTTLGVNYGYTRIDYEHSGASNERNADSHSGYVTLIRRFTPKFSVKLDSGAEWREFGNNNQQVSPLVDGSMTYNYAPRSSATLGLRYSLETTEVSLYRTSDSLSLFGHIDHSITPKLFVGGNVIFSFDSFGSKIQSAVPIPGLPSNPQETSLSAGLSLRYSFTHWCSGEANYTFDLVNVNSGLLGSSFDRDRASLGLRLTY